MPELNAASPATPVDAGSPSGSAPASTPAPSTPAAAPSATPSEPYLKVNDRTVYNTRDDAVKGYSELQDKYLAFQRLFEPQEKGGHGFTGLKSAEDLVYVLDQYVKLSNAGAPPAAAGGATPQAPQGVEQLSPEWQNYIKTLQEKGFVTRDTLDAMKKEILSAGEERDRAQKEDAAIINGKQLLINELKTVGFGDDYVKANIGPLGDAIGSVIGSSQELTQKFIDGNEATRLEIIKECLKPYLAFSDSRTKSQNADYASQKTSAMTNTPRPLTSNSPTPAPPAKTSGKWDIREINRLATEAMEAERVRRGG